MRNRIALSLLALAAAVAARAEFVVNGNFTGADGGPDTAGWTVNDSIDANNYRGPNCVRGGTQNGVHGELSQTLALREGAAYRLTFLAFANQGPGSDNGIDVRLGSSLLYTNSGNLDADWAAYRVDFTATSETLLRFTLRDRNSSVSLTNISVQAVPEPSSLAALALSGGIFLRRRRK